MSYTGACHGRIDLGALSPGVRDRLARLPGEWLEYDPSLGGVVVRHVQPTESPVLLCTASELVRFLSEIPFDQQVKVPGGDLFVHLEETGQLVRLRVEAGGTLHIHWAHPDYAGAKKRPYDGHEIAIEAWEHRLNGSASLTAAEAEAAADALQTLADTFEGLYPEGDFCATAEETGLVRIDMRDVNLDARLLVDRLEALAAPRTLNGRIDVSSFGDAAPDHIVRLVFENGKTWVQHPLLWSEPSA
jgi:hypothetical protein